MTNEPIQPSGKNKADKPVPRAIVFSVKDRATAEQAAQVLRQKHLVRPDVQIRHAGELVEVRVHTREKLVDEVVRTIETFELAGPIRHSPRE